MIKGYGKFVSEGDKPTTYQRLRVTIESVLGRRNSGEPPTLSEDRRQELLEQLQRYFAEVDARRQAERTPEA
ncbi:MAG TPA: hypothetical protein VI636_14565 [Candidatus Angelobacter sp.]